MFVKTSFMLEMKIFTGSGQKCTVQYKRETRLVRLIIKLRAQNQGKIHVGVSESMFDIRKNYRTEHRH